ncbi:MAG: M48 family metalloprotease [Silvanigrellaceae bacterium]
MLYFRGKFSENTAAVIASIAVGALFAIHLNSMTPAVAAETKTSVSEDIYNKLFSKKRTGEAVQKRARSNTAIMGIRGLDDDPDAPIKASANANMRAVYDMEDSSADPKIVEELVARIKAESANIKKESLPPIVNATQPSPVEFEGEIDLGRKMAAQVLGANQTYTNKMVSRYIQALVKVLAENGTTAGRPYRVAILNSEKINAFACPGGYIFVTKGALKATRSEAQLASLLGHEIVHVSKRHLITSMQKRVSNGSDGQVKGSVDPIIERRKRIRNESDSDTSALAQLLGPKGVGLSLLQASSEALDTLLSKGLEKEFELEADRLGQQISSSLGYDPKSLQGFLTQIMEKQTGKTNSTFNTHPPYQARIENLGNFIGQLVAEAGPGISGSPLFAAMQMELTRP